MLERKPECFRKREKMNIPAVTREEMIEIDRLMIEEYGISLLQMMENAGRNLAELCRRMLGGKAYGKRILILCGSGNNGGGGMVAARHLSNWGAGVSVAIAGKRSSLKDAPAHQLRSLEKMSVNMTQIPSDQHYDLILDALIGYGLTGPPRKPIANWIDWMNNQKASKISLDIPSGLDANTGKPLGVCVCADATLTLALPKVGLMTAETRRYTGDLYLGDISVPPQILKEVGFEDTPIFKKDAIIPIDIND